MILNLKAKKLKETNSFNTLNEILQQPDLWLMLIDVINDDKNLKIQKEIENYLKNDNLEVVMMGAGTSEFIGNSLYPYFRSNGINAVSISTTNITSNAEEYLIPNKKYLFVHFARSGNSPESIAAYNIANKIAPNSMNVIITCNGQGKLAQIRKNDLNHVVILPPETNDLGFAMTSSFTCMILSCLLLVDKQNFNLNINDIKQLSKQVKNDLNQIAEVVNQISRQNFERIVFLGSGVLNGFAQEAHLKLLELTAGQINSFFNTPLGFRHGPKSILNSKTGVFMFLNNDKYKRAYDIDLFNELFEQKQIQSLVVFDCQNNLELATKADYYLTHSNNYSNDVFDGLDYIVKSQIFAYITSYNNDLTVDNPWPNGVVNRVVQGVIIHEYNKK